MNVVHAEDASAASTNLQAARLAAVGELAASVAHELNNALGTITLRIEGLLAGTQVDDPRRHAVEVIDQEVERMAALVSNLLEFARPGRGRTPAVAVCEEVARTVDLTANHLAKAAIRVTTEFGRDVPPIHADRQQLRQVLLNLFTNAADAMSGGGRLVVRLAPGVVAEKIPGVLIEVEDTGVGIPPDILPRVTEPFYTTKGESKGTGLGLSICKQIVEDHGGWLRIESRPGVGTTVRVALPLRSPSDIPDGVRNVSTQRTGRCTLNLAAG